MIKNLLRWDQTLFRDPDVFEPDYLPEQLSHRNSQIEELAFQVSPGLRGCTPANVLCRGLPGTGKTTCVRKLFAEITEQTNTLFPVHINCQVDRTKFAVLSRIFKELTGNFPPMNGTSFRKVLDGIARIVVSQKNVLLVCLDDISFLEYEGTLNDVFSILLRAREDYPGLRIGIIATANVHTDPADLLDPGVYSVFRPAEVLFAPYGSAEIRDILRQRIVQGVYPGVISGEILDNIVEQTMRIGDLRVGLAICRNAVLSAEKDGRREVTGEDITDAYTGSKDLHLRVTLRTLSAGESLLLRQIAEISRDCGTGRKQMTSGALYRSAGESMQMSYTTFFERLRKYEAMRIIDLNYGKSRGRKGRTGRTQEITLRYDASLILKEITGVTQVQELTAGASITL